MNHKPLLTLLALLFIFAACKKDSGTSGPPPASEPLNIAAAKPGDTLYIKGENFSTDLTKNTVQINGVAATIVVASATELKVVIPTTATTGAVTVTVNGQTIEVGTLTIVPPTLFVYKRNYQDPNNYLKQLFTIDPVSGQETLLCTLPDSLSTLLEDPVYLPATNEIIGLSGYHSIGLFKVNVTTKQTAYVTLGPSNPTGDFMELVVDKFSNLYSIKRDWSNPNHYMQTLVKVDPKTGAHTNIKSFEYGAYWSSLVYLPSSNEVIGITGPNELIKLNLTTKDTSWVILPGDFDKPFYELAVDNQSNLYGFQAIYAAQGDGQGHFHKLNPVTGQATLLHTFNNYHNVESNMVYLPNRNELVAVWDLNKLYRFNITTKATGTAPLTTQTQNMNYGDLVVN